MSSAIPDPTNYRDFLRRGGVADLSDRVQLRLTGADRVRFLNGQVTADVRKLAPGGVLPACVTTARGKLCAEIFVTATADALLLDGDATLRNTLAPRLERYIIADDVTLEDVTGTIHLVHLAGSTPENSSVEAARGANRFGRPGVDLRLNAAAFAEMWPRFTAERVVLDEPLCETLRLEAGLPRWGRELTEDTLPPEAGLDRTHIDYHKGCYIGQEVISRIKSVGHVNRTLTGFVSEDRAPLTAGSVIFTSEESDARPVGTLTSAAWSFALERPIALGYLKRGSPTGGLIARPADSTGPGVRVTPHPLPFSA
jgi:folate-binding protein YgfZ